MTKIKYKKCKSFREFKKIFRKYIRDFFIAYHKSPNRHSLCHPWFVWIEYDMKTLEEIKAFYASAICIQKKKSCFAEGHAIKHILQEIIANYGKEFKNGKLIGLNITDEDYYYIYEKDGKCTYDSCVGGLS